MLISFGELLKRWREARGLTYRDLAAACRPPVDHAYLYRLENELKGNPSSPVLKSIFAGLRLSELETAILEAVAEQGSVEQNLLAALLDAQDEWDGDLAYSAITMRFRGEKPGTIAEWNQKLRDLKKLLK